MVVRKLALTALICLVALAGCQTNVSRKDAIRTALYSYEKAVRWMGPAEAYKFLREDLQPAYLPDDIGHYKVVGYRVIAPPVEFARGRVVQTVELRYVNTETQVTRELVDEQLWESQDDQPWRRANPIPPLQ